MPSTRLPTASPLDTEQFLGAVVEQRDVALVVHRDHALADAVQQRFPVIGQAGDLGDLQTAGVSLDPPRQQPGRQQAERGAETEVEQQAPARAAELFPHRRIRLADRCDGEHVAVHRQDRHLTDKAVHTVDVVVAEPCASLVGPARAEVHPRADRATGPTTPGSSPSGPRISAMPAPESATARSISGASTCAAAGSANRSRTIGVDARFSATAIIR